jgi:hypothetical protein
LDRGLLRPTLIEIVIYVGNSSFCVYKDKIRYSCATGVLNFLSLKGHAGIGLENMVLDCANVGYGLLTVGGLLTVLNIKTTSKCLIKGIFLIKGITQHYPRY